MAKSSTAGPKRFTLPAWAFLPYWMGLQLLSITLGAQDGVAYAVHADEKSKPRSYIEVGRPASDDGD